MDDFKLLVVAPIIFVETVEYKSLKRILPKYVYSEGVHLVF